jgi:hypothetical protein
MKRWHSLLLLLVLAPSAVSAQVRNPEFSLGSQGWELSGNWTFPSTGGSPGGFARFEGPGVGTLSQVFSLPGNTDDQCSFFFSTRVSTVDGQSLDRAIVGEFSLVLLAGQTITGSLSIRDWPGGAFEIANRCGANKVAIRIETTDAIWVDLDNLNGTFAVGARSPSWGRVKQLFQ